jgi:hypothetical protein
VQGEAENGAIILPHQFLEGSAVASLRLSN